MILIVKGKVYIFFYDCLDIKLEGDVKEENCECKTEELTYSFKDKTITVDSNELDIQLEIINGSSIEIKYEIEDENIEFFKQGGILFSLKNNEKNRIEGYNYYSQHEIENSNKKRKLEENSIIFTTKIEFKF